MTLNELLQNLAPLPQTAELIFTTPDGDISGGYHVTELKHATISSIDCGGRVDDWAETSVQLLDGSGGARMTVDKFTTLARQSTAKLAGLADARLVIEFAPRNTGLRSYELAPPHATNDGVIITLSERRALCKPSLMMAAKTVSTPPAPLQVSERGCCS